MTTVLCIAAVSLLGVFPLCLAAFHLSVGISLLIAFAAYLILHVFFLLFFALPAQTIPIDRPLEKQHRLIQWGASETLSMALFYSRVRPVVTGLEKLPKEGRFLYVSNHRSGFDPLIVMDKLRDYTVFFISKPSNMRLRFSGHWAYAAGCLPIDRDNDRNALKTIITAADYMKRGICSIGIYPEGTRSKTKEMLPFHAGSFKAAQKAKVPIVVASVHGTEKARKFNLLFGTKVYLDILEVIPAETVCALRTDALSEKVRAIIQADLDRTEKQEA